MRDGTAGRMARAAALAVLCLGAAACDDEPSAERTVTVTDPAVATAPATTAAAATTAPAATTPATTPDTPLTERPAGFPTTGERFLLARIDPDIARRCTREAPEDRSDDAIAGITCDTESVYGVRSYFELFRSRVAMETSYGRVRDANDVPVASGQCVPPGGGGRVPGEAPWGFGAEAPSEGRVMCFRDGGEIWFVTSVEKANVLAFARSDRFGALDRFWRTAGIPRAEPAG